MKATLLIAGKELKDIFRDRRAVFIALVFPVILFPLLLFIINIDDKSALGLPEEINCSLQNDDGTIGKILKADKKIKIIFHESPAAGLEEGKLHAYITITNTDKTGIPSLLIINCDNTRQSSVSSAAYISSFIEGYNKGTIKTSLPFSAEIHNSESDARGAGKIILSTLLPVLLLLFSSVAPLAVAADLGAGEKERRTIQGLLTMPVKRWQILLGKYYSVTAFGLAGLVSFLIGVSSAFFINPGIFGNNIFYLNMDLQSVILSAVFGLLLVMIFSALELAISLFARTIKEAQIIFIPVLMAVMTCGYYALLHDPKNVPWLLFNIPLLNICLALKQLTLDIIIWNNILAGIGWAIAYVILLLSAAYFIFKREKIIYSIQ